MLDLPLIDVPTGLYARGLDPMALDDLGFERDEVACVTLEAPTEEVIEDGAAALEKVVDLQEKVSRDARRVAGRCSCEVAREVGAHDLLVTCIDEPT